VFSNGHGEIKEKKDERKKKTATNKPLKKTHKKKTVSRNLIKHKLSMK